MFSNAARGTANAVHFQLGAVAIASWFLAAATVACGGPPKQAEVADVEKESGVDMAGGTSEESAASSAPAPAGGEAAPAGGETEMRTKCCVECKAGAAKDRTGAAKSTIPCADFTDTLSPWCLEHFRGHPAMASQCE